MELMVKNIIMMHLDMVNIWRQVYIGDANGRAFDAGNGELSILQKQTVTRANILINDSLVVFATGGNNAPSTINFGQKPFKFPPPDGFQPLNTANVRPVNVISRPDQYVGITTWSGDGDSCGRRINIGLSPDLIWLKSR